MYRQQNISFARENQRLKDPVKVAENKLEVKKKNELMLKNMTNNDGLDPLYARIIAIGFSRGDGKVMARTTIIDEGKGSSPVEAERVLLEKFFQYLHEEPGPILGYNIEAFDIPMLIARSIDHGMKLPAVIQLFPKVDLMKAMNGFQWTKNYRSQVETCLALGMKIDLSIINSSEMYERYRNGDIDWIMKHLKQDVRMSEFLFHKLKDAGVVDEQGANVKRNYY